MPKTSRARGASHAGVTTRQSTAYLPDTDLVVDGALEVRDGIRAGAPILTNHDRLWWFAEKFGPDDATAGYADLVPNHGTDGVPAYWAFDGAGATERIKWTWSPGDGWEAYTIRMAWVTPGASNSGSVIWRYKATPFTFGSGVVTSPVLLRTLSPIAAPAPLGSAWTYTTLIESHPIVLGSLDEVPLIESVIDRPSGTAGDDAVFDVGVWAVSATRAER